MRGHVAVGMYGRMKPRSTMPFVRGQQVEELIPLRLRKVEGKAGQAAAGRPGLVNEKMPARSAGASLAQRAKPEARRGSSGALSVSLL